MSGEQILVADDEPKVVEVCIKALVSEGYRVYAAHGGRDALICLEAQHFDLLLVDLMMPDVDGLTVLRRARELDPSIMVVVITAYGTLRNAVDVLRAGARGFLVKPFNLDDLLLAVSEALEERRQEQENLRWRALLPILEISQAMMAKGDVASLVERLLEVVVQQVGADRASLMLLDEGADELYTVGAAGLPAGAAGAMRVPVAESVAGHALRGTAPLVLDERRSPEAGWEAPPPGFEGVPAVCVPLCVGEKAVGVLNLGRLAGGASFSPAELNLLSIVGNQIATALENVRLYEAVARSKREWEETFDAIADAIFVTDADAHITRANRALSQWLDRAPDSLIGRSCAKLLGHCHALSETCPCFKVLETGQPRGVERGLSGMDGDFLYSIYPLCDEQGEVTASVHVLRDITERKQAEEALRKREETARMLSRAGQAFNSSLDLDQVLGTVLEEVRRLLDVIACSVWLVDPETGELVCRQSTGPHNEEVRGWRLAPGEGIAGWVAHGGEGLVVPDAQADGRYSRSVERQTGLPLRSILAVPLRVRENVIGVLQVLDTEVDRFAATDLTLIESLAASAASAVENARLFERAQLEIAERSRAEEEIHRRNEELAALNAIAAAVNQSLDLQEVLDAVLEEMLAVLEVEGGLIYLFDETSQTFLPAVHRGFSPGVLGGISQFKLDEGPLGRAAQTGKVLLVPDLAADALEIPPASLEEGWRSLVSVPMKAKGGAVGMMTLVSRAEAGFPSESLDMLTAIGNQIGVAVENVQLAREAGEVEILRELDRLRAQLIANVSHELRTPLGLIKIFCTTLLRENMHLDSETRREFLHHIDEETDRLEEIVDNLLDLSRMRDGRLRLDMSPTDVGQLAREVMEAMEVHLVKHRFAHDFSSEPLIALVDANRIEQVLRNLLSNAIKYSPEGGIITVQGRGDERQLLIGVSDQGIGIPREDLEMIFERFYRVENELSRGVRGVGLGLAVCLGIVEAHGGRIWVESTLGVGSTFYVSLPVDGGSELAVVGPGYDRALAGLRPRQGAQS